MVYVSLDPGTAPGATRAIVRRVGDATVVTPAVVAGGFDPVAIVAQAGDSIDVVVMDAGGGVVYQVRAAVVAIRPPVIVRTDPPPKKRDVPLNASIVIVFSEPIDSATLTPASVRLLRGRTAVAGSVEFLDAAQLKAAFVPNAQLAVQTDYQLVISQTVRDRDGQALAAPDTVPFTTGSLLTGPPATISFSVDSGMPLALGASFQMTATVRDAAGNELTDQLITWFTTDSTVLTVTATGWLTAVGDGYAYVGASAGVVGNQISVRVSALPSASVTVTPVTTTVGAGDTVMLKATVRDSTGRIINHPSVTWTSSAPGVATVATAGDPRIATVTGVTQGSVTVTASIGTGSASADVTVGPPVPLSSVTVAPASARLVVQGTVQLAATLRDANGKVLFARPTTWASDNGTVATVDTNGLVTAGGIGSVTVTATSEGVSGTAVITVTTIVFQSLSANYGDTCGLATNGAAYCWGYNSSGQLGNGTTGYSSVPVPVSGGLSFTLVTTGENHTCGLTAGGVAYCWGWNRYGELGDATTTDRLTPVPVAGGLRFTALVAGFLAHTCALTASGAAYCWGSTTGSSVPVPVPGGLSFTLLTAGDDYTCGLIASGAAYCWGGSGSVPTLVSGGLTFTSLSTQFGTTCGVIAGGAAACWGNNSYGQIGDGTTTDRSGPVPVLGGLSFVAVSPGDYHTCALTANGAAYCWGMNSAGQLGDGLTSNTTFPVPVAGGLSFTVVQSGGYHACGIAGGVAYCWGDNSFGQVGVGSSTVTNAPVKVAGQP